MSASSLSDQYNELASRLGDATALDWRHIQRTIYAGDPALDMLAVTFPDKETATQVEAPLNAALTGASCTWNGQGPFGKEPLKNGRAFVMAGRHMQGQVLLIPAPAVADFAEQNEYFFDMMPKFEGEPA